MSGGDDAKIACSAVHRLLEDVMTKRPGPASDGTDRPNPVEFETERATMLKRHRHDFAPLKDDGEPMVHAATDPIVERFPQGHRPKTAYTEGGLGTITRRRPGTASSPSKADDFTGVANGGPWVLRSKRKDASQI